MLNKTDQVKQQYSDDKNLSIRSNLHLKYSTNKKGLFPWLFEQYQFEDNQNILELGCGNGAQWEGRIESLPGGCNLVLSDFSKGMVDIVREKYKPYKNVSCKQIDIQNIDYPDETFDVAIANHMLYHVPDLSKAISEVNRVLKKDGIFYCTTNGNGGMWAYIANAIQQFDPEAKTHFQGFSFNLQNGEEILREYFSTVQRIDYEDSLLITNTKDLINWVKSAITFSGFPEVLFDKLFDSFEKIRKRDGAIHIPKEAGLFISKK